MLAELRRGCRAELFASIRRCYDHSVNTKGVSTPTKGEGIPELEDAMTSGEMAAPGLSDASTARSCGAPS